MPYVHSILDIQGTTLWEVAAIQSMMSLLAVIVAVNVGVLVYARTATRQREAELRRSLREMRTAIDRYKDAADLGQISPLGKDREQNDSQGVRIMSPALGAGTTSRRRSR